MTLYTVVRKPVVFYTKGRERPVRRIVLHWMATNLAGCDATFAGGQREASAHYGLEDDKRHGYVREEDTAWHAGVRTINHESIGVEHSAQPGRAASEGTIANSIDLCTELCRRYGLTADAIDQHSDFYATQCPGTLPVSRIREAVRANLAGTKEWFEMPLDAQAKQDVVDAVIAALKTDGLVASPAKSNPTVAPVTGIGNAGAWALQARDAVASLAAQVTALDAKVSAIAPAQPSVISDDQLERALRKVIGSVDNTPSA